MVGGVANVYCAEMLSYAFGWISINEGYQGKVFISLVSTLIARTTAFMGWREYKARLLHMLPVTTNGKI
jgi:hypothetical protein